MRTKWIQYAHEPERIKKRVFCFPYAGGGALFFSKWYENLSDDIGVYPIQLPGRENRMAETPLRNLQEVSEKIVDEIKYYIDLPYVFIGHSMGGLIAYEVTRILQEKGYDLPLGIIISATVPPDKLALAEHISNLSDKEFCTRIIGYEDINPKILKYKEFYKYFLPVLKSDFTMVETYNLPEKQVINTKIIVLGGFEDDYVPVNYLGDWCNYSSSPIDLKLYQGNHFFIKKRIPEICTLIEKIFVGE